MSLAHTPTHVLRVHGREARFGGLEREKENCGGRTDRQYVDDDSRASKYVYIWISKRHLRANRQTGIPFDS